MTRLFALALAALLAGCSAYQLGGPKPAFRRIEVAPVRNATSRAGTHAVLHGKLVEALAADPRVKVGPGEALLEAEVVRYQRDGFTTKTGDAYAYTSYRVSFEVRCTLTTDGGKRVLFKDRVFRSVATLQLAGDAAAEELSLGPTLFGDIAAQVREAATTAW
jgi:hypothetical protein